MDTTSVKTKVETKVTEDDLWYDCVIIVYEHQSDQSLQELGRIPFMGAHKRPELDQEVLKVVQSLKEAYEFYPDAYISIKVVNNYGFVNI
jgi:hypothetical protein